jgi:hypothetical protein
MSEPESRSGYFLGDGAGHYNWDAPITRWQTDTVLSRMKADFEAQIAAALASLPEIPEIDLAPLYALLEDLDARVAALEGATTQPEPVPEPEPAEPEPEPEPAEPEPEPEPVPEPTPVPADALNLSAGLSLRSGKIYAGSISGSGEHGVYGSNITGTTIVEAAASGFRFGIAIWGGKAVLIDRFSGQCRTPIYAAGLTDSELRELALVSVSKDKLDHPLYLESACRNIKGRDWHLTAGAGYALHLYGEGTLSEGLEAENVYLDARTGLYPVVIHNWRGVHLRGLESHAAAGRAHFDLWDCSDVIVEDFQAEGGASLVQHLRGTCSNVVFRNGTFKGPRLLPDGKPIAGVTFENVKLI